MRRLVWTVAAAVLLSVSFASAAHAAPTPISAIQGSGNASPLVGQDVTIEGVVTGIDDEQGASFGSGNAINRFPGDAGIYVQSNGAGDGDDATSEGIFVGFVGAAGGDGPRSQFLGKRVRVTGRVVEQFGFTQLNETINQEPVILGDAPTLPTPVTIDPAQAAAQTVTPAGSVTGTRSYYERFEGMRVRLATATANSGGTNKFGELFVTPGTTKDRVFRIEVQPDLISVDADAGSGNPSNPFIPAQQSTTYVKADLFDTVSDAVGPLGFSFRNYKITPQEGTEPTVAETGVAYPYTGVPAQPANTVRVTAFNVENFFPVGGALDGGNVTAEEFAERRDHIADAISRLLKRPDVVGVEEVADLASLQAVATKLGGYTAYLEEGNDTRGIDVGYLIKSTVTATNVRQLGKTATNPTVATCSDVAGRLFDRPPLAADITTPNGRTFTVLNNHFASKAAPDACRAAQAAFNRDQVVAIEAAGGEAMVMGDINAFEDESALTTLEGPETSLDNLWDTAPEQERYSFAFQGKLQTLDHILITDGLTSNAFQYALFDNDYYDREDPMDGHKTSDHDPPLVTLADAPGETTGPSPTGPPPTAPVAAPVPIATSPVASVDRSAPGLALSATRILRVRTMRARGLRATVTCSEACRLSAVLTLDAATARKLGLRSRRIASRTATIAGAGSRVVLLRLTTAARARLRGSGRATLQVAARDAAGNRRTRSKLVMLRP